MESGLFRRSRRLKVINLLSNICINETFSDLKALSNVVDRNCEKAAEVEPICEVIKECPLGNRCCRLSKFKTNAHSELKDLTHYRMDAEVDAISYNNNSDVELLLSSMFFLFQNLKVYDASNCAVREVFFENFQWFKHLEIINLANNQISTLFGKPFHRMPLKNLNLCNYILILTFPLTKNFIIFQLTTA